MFDFLKEYCDDSMLEEFLDANDWNDPLLHTEKCTTKEIVRTKISDNLELLEVAAQNFLNKNTAYISGIAQQLLEGNIREIVGQMRLEQMVSDRQTFAEKPAEFDPRKYLGPARDNMEKMYKHKIINVLGSDGKLG